MGKSYICRAYKEFFPSALAKRMWQPNTCESPCKFGKFSTKLFSTKFVFPNNEDF